MPQAHFPENLENLDSSRFGKIFYQRTPNGTPKKHRLLAVHIFSMHKPAAVCFILGDNITW